MQNDLNRLEAKVNLTKYAPNQVVKFKLNQSQDWVRELLKELNENATARAEDDYLGETNLEIELELKKIHNSSYGPVLLSRGKISAHYVTECVRTLEEMTQDLECEFQLCFIDAVHEGDKELEDQIDIFIDNQMHDLHFYELNRADLKEAIHEVIFLNINQYPVSSYDKPLDYGNNKQ